MFFNIKSFISNLFFIIFLCSIQIMIINQVGLLYYSNIYIYILFVITYSPYEKQFLLILFSFIIGITIDYFMITNGIHAFSMTLLAFLKEKILRFFAGKNIITNDDFHVHELSFVKKFFYTISLIIIYYTSIIIFELFKNFNFLTLLKRTFLGVLSNTSLFLIYLSLKRNRI